MTHWLRTLIVVVLERFDTLLDHIPTYSYSTRRWYRHGDLGCRLGLASLSETLDEKWGTDVWRREEQ